MKEKEFITEFKRIENIKNIPYDSYDMQPSYRILIENFIKKSCKACDYKGGDNLFFGFDGPTSYKRNLPDTIKDKIKNMIKENEHELGRVATCIILEIYLMWVYIAENDKDDLKAREFVEAYELLVVLRERRGCIFREEGIFWCGASELRQATMKYYFPDVEDTSKENLDKYDSSGVNYFNKIKS